MGGGVAMRAAAKVAGLGVLNGGLRGGENPVARRSVVASVVSSSDDVKLAIASKTTNSSSLEKDKAYDDWEFADEDPIPMPRVVFGGAPTIQEAKQATSDLTHALDKTYLSPNEEKFGLDTCVSKHAIQAFRLLHQNTEAQNVVASIASDPNVWTAVLKNEALVDFLQTQKTSVVFPQVNDDIDCQPEVNGESKSASASGKGFRDYVEDIKQKISVTVVDMMTSLSDTFQSLFGGGSAKAQEFTMNPDGTAGISVEKTTIAATLMGLAIMVIGLVVLKRP